MDTFLLALGWWNFVGSIMMLFMVYQPFGHNVLVVWTRIFRDDFVLNYWGKLWLLWAAGINIFFGLMHIMAVKWGYLDVKLFLIKMDIAIYAIFVLLVIWGISAKRMGSGVYSVFVVFLVWLTWAILSLCQA